MNESARGLKRRQFISQSVKVGGGLLAVSVNQYGQRITIATPPTPAWVEPMPVPAIASPTFTGTGCETSLLDPSFSTAGRQRFGEFSPQAAYDIDVRPCWHIFHPALPVANLFGYNGTVPGPTFQARYGTPIVVRFRNKLNANHTGFGIPQTTVHLHNLHTPSESDGFPLSYVAPGAVLDQHYPMMKAAGDANDALGTLWYHEHRIDFTAQNVYRGLHGFFEAFDDVDTNNENDSSQTALRLPSGAYDVPMVFTDPQFNSAGAYYFDTLNTDGFLGDRYAVNGKLYPFLDVQRRRYRFRFLVASPSRVYELFLTNGTQDFPFRVISNDGNLLPAALDANSLMIPPASRFDVVVDFTAMAGGTVLYLENRAEQTNGRGPTGRILARGSGRMLKIVVNGEGPSTDFSLAVPVGRVLRPTTALPNLTNVRRRTLTLDRTSGQWTVNGQVANMANPAFTIPDSAPEIWTLVGKGAWWHPVHVHFEEGIILSRGGGLPLPYERNARKDVFTLRGSETVEVFFRGFRDFKGKYVMHCHNMVHEDHAMMMRFDIA